MVDKARLTTLKKTKTKQQQQQQQQKQNKQSRATQKGPPQTSNIFQLQIYKRQKKYSGLEILMNVDLIQILSLIHISEPTRPP